MSSSQLENFIEEHPHLIPVYREKWQEIATSRSDHQKAADAIKAIYEAIGKPEPEIQFYDSPYVILKGISFYWLFLANRIRKIMKLPLLEISDSQQEIYELGKNLCKQLSPLGDNFPLACKIKEYVSGVVIDLKEEFEAPILNSLTSTFKLEFHPEAIVNQLWQHWELLCPEIESYCDGLTGAGAIADSVSLTSQNINESIHFNNVAVLLWLNDCLLLDFCYSALNYNYEQEKWALLQSIIRNCGWIFPFEKLCLVCSHPVKLSWNSQGRLHAEGKPAIQFADRWSLYSYQGVILPEKYGKVNLHQWQAKWILEEKNAELRRVLIQEIGYARICQELQATELDSWAEYTLLRIDEMIDDRDRQPIYLLKMICPSTGFIHAMRVPPNMRSAREAICWVNWGIDPEEFSVQS